MAGFSNDTMHAINVDFTGNAHVQPQVTANGQLLIGSTAAPYIRVGTLTPGAGIGILNGSGTITISALTAGFAWNEVTSATNPNSIVKENGYIPKGAGVVTFVLPATAAQGDCFKIAGYGNLWTLTQNALQSISLGAQTSAVGVLGRVSASQVRDTIELVCVTANTEFQIVNSVGNLTFA
jgi:hypothetical protein